MNEAVRPSALAETTAALRWELCYNYYYSVNSRLARERNDHRSQAYAYAQSLQSLRRSFGYLPDTNGVNPGPNAGPMPSGAVKITREWLGDNAPAILGSPA